MKETGFTSEKSYSVKYVAQVVEPDVGQVGDAAPTLVGPDRGDELQLRNFVRLLSITRWTTV
jgi:hypothetical protein